MKYLKYKVIDVGKMYSRNNMNNASKNSHFCIA